MDKRPALGKGLSALIPDGPSRARRRSKSTSIACRRTSFSRARRSTTRASRSWRGRSQSNGVIQPIVVRKIGDRFQIIAGERRWRAAKRAGLLRVPVVVRDVAPGHERSLLEMALIENIQRENLNPIDEALAYRRLADEFQLTQEDIAAAVGKDRASVANFLRLLKLPDEVRAKVASGRLSMGHARALLALAGRGRSACASRATSSRAACRCAKPSRWSRRSPKARSRPRRRRRGPADVHTRAAEDRLRLALGTRVRIVRQGTRGRIEIDFGSEDELIRIYEQLTDNEPGLTRATGSGKPVERWSRGS